MIEIKKVFSSWTNRHLKQKEYKKIEGKYSGNQFLAQGDFTNLALYEKLSIGAMIIFSY